MKDKILIISLFLFQCCCAETLSVETGGAPRPGGSYYSQALYVNHPREILFIAGQLPIDPATNTVIMDPVLATRQCMLNIQALLSNAGMDFSNVKKVIIATTISDTIIIRDICAEYASFLTAPYPTLSVIGVAFLPLGSVVGIEGMAVS
ncbi:hypothetical protein KBB68_01670 [Candidatus Babeliales bacterium]|nr:hypothetical protein [Candidatus Babeliales bacterium]